MPLFLLTFLLQGGFLSVEAFQAGERMESSSQQEERETEQAAEQQQQDVGSAEEQEKADTNKEKCRDLMQQAAQQRDQDRFNEAISAYEEAYKLCSDAAALFFIAEIFDIELNQYKDALSYYERFTQEAASSDDQNKDHARVRIDEIREGMQAYETGNALYKEQRYQEAIQEFERSFGLCPHALHCINVGRCYEKLAIKSYEAFVGYISLKPAAKEPMTDAQEQDAKSRLETLKALPPLPL